MADESHETIGFLLTDVARLLRQRTERAFDDAGLGLTSGEARTLAFASRFSGLRQAALAERMSVEPMTLVGFLDRLEARGLVERVSDPCDRRAKTVHLTPAAEEIVQRFRDIARGTREVATRDLTDADVEKLRAVLLHLRANLTAGDS
ncbi:MarR family winged helix-turn-helix transcriptional regulator [Segnochrobactraceae bacterium EtOH-i3]